MRIHPRESVSRLESLKITVTVNAIWDKHDLTYETIVAVLSIVQSHYLRKIASADGQVSDGSLNPAGALLPDSIASMESEIRAVIDQYPLTNGEILSCLNDQMASAIKYIVREERHPGSPDTPGGIEMEYSASDLLHVDRKQKGASHLVWNSAEPYYQSFESRRSFLPK